MSGHVKLGHHVNTTLFGIIHHLFDIPVRVALLRGEGALPHLGQRGHLHGEGLVVHQMPMQHIQFDPGHGVDNTLDRGDGKVVACGVDHERAVLAMIEWREEYVEEGCVLDLDGCVLDDVCGGLVVELDEEHQ